MRNPRTHPAVRLDTAAFHALVDRARKVAGHTWPQVTSVTGVGIDVFRRLRGGTEPRLPAYLSLATYVRDQLAGEGEAGVQVDLPGAVGSLYNDETNGAEQRD